MKLLYAIQGTGNGHVARARDVVPALLALGHEVDIVISGTQSDIELPFKIDYRFKGLSFVFGKNGGIDFLSTFIKNKSGRFYKEVKELPVEAYDLVLNDFEPVSAWACFLKDVPCIGLSHQAAVMALEAPKPQKSDWMGKMVLKYYAPVDKNYGFHFKSYNATMYTPVIRHEVRAIEKHDGVHYTVYLPSYSDKKLIKHLGSFKEITWQVFSKEAKSVYSAENVQVFPISNDGFLRSMASAKGVLCGAGFETPAEVMYLKKKLMVVPMKKQYEQHCNAAALQEMGVKVIPSLKSKHYKQIENWLQDESVISMDYPDETHTILRSILQEFEQNKLQSP